MVRVVRPCVVLGLVIGEYLCMAVGLSISDCFVVLLVYTRRLGQGRSQDFRKGGGTLKITINSPQMSPEKLFITISATRFRAP